jgi:hypothetical protein
LTACHLFYNKKFVTLQKVCPPIYNYSTDIISYSKSALIPDRLQNQMLHLHCKHQSGALKMSIMCPYFFIGQLTLKVTKHSQHASFGPTDSQYISFRHLLKGILNNRFTYVSFRHMLQDTENYNRFTNVSFRPLSEDIKNNSFTKRLLQTPLRFQNYSRVIDVNSRNA